jgi:hypothetical protein
MIALGVVSRRPKPLTLDDGVEQRHAAHRLRENAAHGAAERRRWNNRAMVGRSARVMTAM